MIALEVQLVKPGGHCRGEKEKEEKLGGSCQLEPRETRNTDGGKTREEGWIREEKFKQYVKSRVLGIDSGN